MKVILKTIFAIMITIPSLVITLLGLHADEVWEEIYKKNFKGEDYERNRKNKKDS